MFAGVQQGTGVSEQGYLGQFKEDWLYYTFLRREARLIVINMFSFKILLLLAIKLNTCMSL